MRFGIRQPLTWHCQTNLNGPVKGAGLRRSGRQLTPLGQGDRTVLFEDIAAVEVTVVVEVVVDRGMGSGKLLESLHVPELRHRSFSSSERLVGILRPIVEPATALLVGVVADYFHCRTVGAKPVSHDRNWPAIAFHHPLEKLQCRFTVSAHRREDLKHLPFVIYRAPEIMRLSIDPDEHLVQVPAPL